MTEKTMPSFFQDGCGVTLLEFVEWALKNRDTRRFDPRIHRNRGWKGSGECRLTDCQICRLCVKYGV